ncbi:hypothetical protein ERO13_D06G025700v2 [Gossypium hirsutum]|uniref:F-box/kelch-repeat protein At2g29820 n=1 Tax=Gossypium hirsutum TaxID=3635 RepID=A0A1U8JII9_GOSHI|nr:putative F-box/kelch-repeat protein At2g29820 [Gossypium hirsutum]XP_016690091.2 putative F-box/kelch-repeat protein At2g29820 [Gossypium hirsutum]XP_016690093.2 putative F-box/kelch-repeat protein At2g29820 [Gossypium hirsutum]XP_016690094.2 putative F-box/kelch-repeat protein At2g29820 [Gossypium hirsutum]XP_016690095.2 putative F-box/kelch-repeat protein At2g29820 [Gossypium hirsutum]XP_016690096.2 putative F-box/kelch-repeat protein At2g29820 [Gossypium hirsutum]XP_040950936.1 putative
MSGNTRNCSSYFDARQRDGEIKGLFFLDKTQRDTEGKRRTDMHFLDLERGEISDVLSTTPPDVPLGATVVTCGNHVYTIGGKILRGGILRSLNHVFRFDFKHAERGWRTVSSMLYPRGLPEALAAQGKIYVFKGSRDCFSEIYDISGDSWVPLCVPSIAEYSGVSRPVLLDSSRSRILVHFSGDRYKSLYAYYYNDKSWVCLDPKFPYWSPTVGIVGNVLYVFHEISDEICSWKAYDVQDKKWLPVKWLTEFSLHQPVTAPVGAPLIHLGNDKWCMVWHSITLNCFEYLIFRMWRNGHGGIYAADVDGYRTSASFGSVNPTILMP